MKKTPVNFPEFSFDINREQTIAFLGSCFSEHLSKKLESFKFNVVSNPLGIIFNPFSLSSFLIAEKEEILKRNFQRSDVWLNWQANATVFGYSNEALTQTIEERREQFFTGLSASKVLFITFGTAWVYEQIDSAVLVANCHKQPANQFRKRLLTIEEIVQQWSTTIHHLIEIYPALNIVFTVSPVRHTKDGSVENTRSKSRLLEAIHELTEKHTAVSYFPVYEFFMDELRDYAFYEKDGIHPNAIAIDLVWEKFEQSFFKEKTKSWLKEYQRLSQKEFVAKAQREMDEFLDN
jgi:lysophospholipase L1-like esterase